MSFIYDLLHTFFGALLAIPIGLFLDRYIKRRQQKEEKKRLTRALIDALRKNVKLIHENENNFRPDNILAKIEIGEMPNLIDMTVLDATAISKYDILGFDETCQAIDDARYWFSWLNIRLNIVMKSAVDKSNENFTKNVYNKCQTMIRNGWIKTPALNAIDKLNKLLNDI